MALNANWAKMSSSTGGTANLALVSISGYPSFTQAFGSANAEVYYVVSGAGRREAGMGTYYPTNTTAGTLQRTTVVESWDGGAVYGNVAVNFDVVGVDVYCGPIAQYLVHAETTQTITGAKTFSNTVTFTSNVNASAVTVTANTFTGNGGGLYSLNASALQTGTVPLAQLTSANVTSNGVMDTTTQTFAGDKTFTGAFTANAGSKIYVQGGIDGTSQRGIFLWSDTNWGMYLSQAGAGKSLANGTAVAGIDGRSGWHVRFRSGSLSSEGFVWENQTETAVMHLASDTGNLYLKGNIYVSNSTTVEVLHTGSTTGINASALSTGTVPSARLSAANSTSNGAVTNTTQTFTGNKTFDSDVTITGNLVLLGQSVTLNTNSVIVQDSLIQLAANNTTSDALDIGLFGNYSDGVGNHEHTGLFRDATDGVWKLFIGLEETPTGTTVNTAGTGYAIGTLQSYLSSTIFSTNSTALAITSNASYSATLTVNTITTGSLSASGVVNALSTLGVTGAATLSNTLLVTGATNVASTLGVGGVFTALSTSTLTGAATFSNTVSITGAVNALSTLGVTGALSVTGAVNALSTLGVGGVFTALVTSTLTGAVTMSNTVSITGAANALSTLGVGGAFSALSTSTLTGAATFSNTVTVTGTATMNGIVDANNKLTLNTTNGRFVLPVGTDKWAT